MEQSLNQLQTATLLLSRLSLVETNLYSISQKLQTLSLVVEEFVIQQRTE